MGKSLVILGFIGAAAAAATLLATRPTVIDGKVMAADLLPGMQAHGFTGTVKCDDRIPIEREGAVFECTLSGDDGSTARIEYTLTRSQQMSARVVDSTGPTRHKVPASSDPWAN
jgi:hypothetical protein